MAEFLADYGMFLVLGILVLFGAAEVLAGLLDHTKRNRHDYLLETASALVLLLLIKPAIVLAVFYLGKAIYPQGTTLLAGYNVWLVMLGYLLVDDLLQYWYHRSAHEHPWLWKLHLPHHTAEEMGLLVSYRSTGLYYVLMPNIWWIALVTYLGGGAAVAIGIILKQIVVISSHSPTKWDRVLYRYKFLAPLAYVVQRIFITPAFHYAHHGKSQKDGISEPNGNYGNMFSFWDQLFGTAHFREVYPVELGLPQDAKDPWTVNYLYPLVGSKKPESELSYQHKKEKTTRNEASMVELEAGKYLWCRCGMSKEQPFCDGSHHGSKIKPLLFELDRPKKVKLCNCKQTQSPPYCDNSHLKL